MEIFKLFGTIMVDNEKANQSIHKTEQKAESLGTKLGNGIKTVGKWGMAFGAAAGVAGAAIGAMATNVANQLGDIADAAMRTGQSAEEFQKWSHAAKMSGMEVETLERAMVKQQKAFSDANEGSKVAAAAYERLGINIKQVGSSSEAFDLVIAKLANMQNETERNALANDIFGKSYAELAPLLAEGASGIDKLKQEAVDLGIVMSNESVAAGEAFGDSLDKLKSAFNGIILQIGSALIPYAQKFVDWVIQYMPEIKEIMSVTFESVGKIVASVAKIFEALLPILKPLWEFIKWAFPKIAETVEFYFGIVADIVGAVADAFEWLQDKIESVFEWFDKWNAADFAEKEITVRTREVRDHERSGRSHAGGLPYVPYDGYVAELHRGERVLTADEAKKSGTSEFAGATNQRQTQPVNVSLMLDSKLLARYMFDALQDEENIRGAILGGAR